MIYYLMHFMDYVKHFELHLCGECPTADVSLVISNFPVQFSSFKSLPRSENS